MERPLILTDKKWTKLSYRTKVHNRKFYGKDVRVRNEDRRVMRERESGS